MALLSPTLQLFGEAHASQAQDRLLKTLISAVGAAHPTPRQQGGLELLLGSLRRFLPLPGE